MHMQALVVNKVGLSLREAVAAAAKLQPITVSDKVAKDVVDYVQGRLEQLITDSGVPAEAGARGAVQSWVIRGCRTSGLDVVVAECDQYCQEIDVPGDARDALLAPALHAVSTCCSACQFVLA